MAVVACCRFSRQILWRGGGSLQSRIPFLVQDSSQNSSRVRQRFYNGVSSNEQPFTAVAKGRLERTLQAYEDFVGLTEVKEAQNKVIKSEQRFLEVQEERRLMQERLSAVQSKLKSVTAELEKINRADDRYLDLVKSEHTVIREENEIIDRIRTLEKRERENFAMLSAAVRESHERERARAERTKYWSIIGSIIGATIGIVGTTFNNYLRMRELRRIVTTSTDSSMEFQSLTESLINAAQSQYNKMDDFLVNLHAALGGETPAPERVAVARQPAAALNVAQGDLEKQTEVLLSSFREQADRLDNQIGDVKRLLGLPEAKSGETNVVYVGPELQQMLKKTEENLEWKMKLNAVASATLVYTALALSLPVVLAFFKGWS